MKSYQDKRDYNIKLYESTDPNLLDILFNIIQKDKNYMNAQLIASFNDATIKKGVYLIDSIELKNNSIVNKKYYCGKKILWNCISIIYVPDLADVSTQTTESTCSQCTQTKSTQTNMVNNVEHLMENYSSYYPHG